jgi:hypothetical protein
MQPSKNCGFLFRLMTAVVVASGYVSGHQKVSLRIHVLMMVMMGMEVARSTSCPASDPGAAI